MHAGLITVSASVVLALGASARADERSAAQPDPRVQCCRSVREMKGGAVGRGCKAIDDQLERRDACMAAKRTVMGCEAPPKCDKRGTCSCPKRGSSRSAAFQGRVITCDDRRCPSGYFCVALEEGRPRVCRPGVDTNPLDDFDGSPDVHPDGEVVDSIRKEKEERKK